jgi:ribosome-binding factor A
VKHRRERVAHDLRDRIAEIIERRTNDPRLRQLTITGVEVSPDFSSARVFYRAQEDAQEVAAALDKASGFIRRRLAEGLALRRVPELRFLIDVSLERGARVEQVLREIAAETEAAGSDEAAAASDGDGEESA